MLNRFADVLGWQKRLWFAMDLPAVVGPADLGMQQPRAVQRPVRFVPGKALDAQPEMAVIPPMQARMIEQFELDPSVMQVESDNLETTANSNLELPSAHTEVHIPNLVDLPSTTVIPEVTEQFKIAEPQRSEPREEQVRGSERIAPTMPEPIGETDLPAMVKDLMPDAIAETKVTVQIYEDSPHAIAPQPEIPAPSSSTGLTPEESPLPFEAQVRSEIQETTSSANQSVLKDLNTDARAEVTQIVANTNNSDAIVTDILPEDVELIGNTVEELTANLTANEPAKPTEPLADIKAELQTTLSKDTDSNRQVHEVIAPRGPRPVAKSIAVAPTQNEADQIFEDFPKLSTQDWMAKLQRAHPRELITEKSEVPTSETLFEPTPQSAPRLEQVPLEMQPGSTSKTDNQKSPLFLPARATGIPTQQASNPSDPDLLQSTLDSNDSTTKITDVSKTDPALLGPTQKTILQAWTGIDPETVVIRRDDAANAVTSALNAHGMAVNDQVLLAHDSPRETAAELGLIGHELAHIARKRKPGFIPPAIARVASEQSRQVSAAPPEGTNQAGMTFDASSEEGIAQTVEARIVHAAQADLGPKPDSTTSGISDQMLEGPSEQVEPWHGLPAPWQPLPEWFLNLTAQPGKFRSDAPIDDGHLAPQVVSSQGQWPTSSLSAPLDSTPMMALRNRATATLSEPSSNVEPVAVQPNLDQLARQVYSVLKHRLAAEARRA